MTLNTSIEKQHLNDVSFTTPVKNQVFLQTFLCVS